MMTRKTLTAGLWTLAGALLVALACVVSTPTAQAQDPIGGALATLAAATAQAERVRAAQRATAAALSAEGTRQATIAQATARALSAAAAATSQAQSAEATQTALDALNRQRAAMATAEYHAAQSTQQAQQATAQALSASATRNVIDAQATRAAYDLWITQSKQQAQLGRILLYVAASLSLLGTAYVIATWARAIAKRLTEKPKPTPQTAAADSVIDGEYQKLPGSTERMPEGVTFVDDPALTDAIGRWFYEGEAQ